LTAVLTGFNDNSSMGREAAKDEAALI